MPPLSYPGVDGFREAIDDWLSPWKEFRFEIEELIPADEMLVLLVRQIGKTKHAGVEVAADSATVWWVEDDEQRRRALLSRPAGRAEGGRARSRPPITRS